MKKLMVFLTVLILVVTSVRAQQGVAINSTGLSPDSKAMLDISSADKGLLIPRMTATQRIAIAPVVAQKGLLVFDTDSSAFIFWTGVAWQKISATAGSGSGEWTRTGSDIFNSNTGNVGIAVNNPKVPLHVAENKMVLFGKDTSGGGSRLMWIPTKKAFRVGAIGPFYEVGGGEYDFGDAAAWDYDSVGYFSVAGGFSNKAKGNSSTAFGGYNEAIGQFSIALGAANTANGHYSFSAGVGSISTGYNSVAIGQHAKSLRDNAVAIGNYVEATGSSSFATGYISVAPGNYSTAMGYHARSNGDYSFAIGYQTEATGFYSSALGRNCLAIGNSGFASGYLTSAAGHYSVAMGRSTQANGSNSFASGYLSIAGGNYAVTFGQSTQANGSNSFASGYLSQASGDYSTATGRNTHASGNYACTLGANTNAAGNYSLAAGFNSQAQGLYSISLGHNTRAIGDNTFAAGTNTHANGIYSTALGLETIANARSSFVIGRYNDSVAGSNPYTWVATDPLFIIGNGYANDNRNNVLTVLKNGKFGFGTNNPAANLHVRYNGSSSNPQLLLEESTTDYSRLLFKNSNAWANWTVAAFIQPSGDYNSNARLNFDFSGYGNVFNLFGNGNAGLHGTLYNTSDERMKKNIKPLGTILNRVMQLSGYTYQWKDAARGQDEQIGFLAQELEIQFPQLVATDEKGMKSVAYANMVPVLLQAIKEQQVQIEELKKLVMCQMK